MAGALPCIAFKSLGAPTALGSKTATVNVATSGAGTQRLPLTGTGITAYTVSVSSLVLVTNKGELQVRP